MSDETEREEESVTGRTMDTELRAISAILRQLRDPVPAGAGAGGGVYR